MRGLEAKRILITGGASGIGAATAARFLDEGSVVCVLDRDADARPVQAAIAGRGTDRAHVGGQRAGDRLPAAK